MKNKVLGTIEQMINLKMLAMFFFVVCSTQVVQAADNAKKKSEKLHEREKSILQLVQRHHLWSLGEMLDKHSVCNQARRVRDNFQEVENIAQFSAQFKTKVDEFQTEMDKCHPALKQDLQMIHAQGLLPIPDIMQQFFVGRIRQGTNDIPTTSYASTYALSQLFAPKSPDLVLFHKQLVQAATTYKKRLKKGYSLHNKKFPQWSVPDQKERAILRQEYRESILPFIACVGVIGHIQKKNPEAFAQALFIWDNTRDLELPKL